MRDQILLSDLFFFIFFWSKDKDVLQLQDIFMRFNMGIRAMITTLAFSQEEANKAYEWGHSLLDCRLYSFLFLKRIILLEWTELDICKHTHIYIYIYI